MLALNEGLMRITHRASRPLLAAAVVTSCLLCGVAQAQSALPQAAITAPALSGDQKKDVAEFARPLLPQLATADKLKSARESLLSPLQERAVSPSFRLALWEGVAPTVRTMVKSDNDQQVVNGLRIAGEIATDTSLEVVPELLRSKKPSIRFAASFAIMRCFEETQGKTPAIGLQKANELVAALGDALKAETDTNCQDSLVRALAAAASDKQSLEKIQGEAVRVLSKAVSARFQRAGANIMDDRSVEVTVRAMRTIQDSLTKQPKPSWTSEGVEAAGDALSYVYRMLRKPNTELTPVRNNDTDELIESKKKLRTVYAPLISVAETAIYFGRKFDNADANQTAISKDFKEADGTRDGTALSDMDVLLKEKLPKEFSLPANRFLN